MSPAQKASPTLPESSSSLNPEGHHTCTRCPVCSTEACAVLEQLGMFCETMCAASQAQAKTQAQVRVKSRERNTFVAA